MPIDGPPNESYRKIFLRFLRFGCLAWGGPVAQIDMVRHELVEEERWVTNARFKKLLAIYQVLPGPEAHELCVYFGMLAGGRLGGILAGLGFMLPGFVLMFLLSWLYVSYRITETPLQAVFLGIQPAVIALIFRASHRISTHVLTDKPLLLIAGTSAIADLLGLPFWITLPFAGGAYLLSTRQKPKAAAFLAVAVLAAAVVLSPQMNRLTTARPTTNAVTDSLEKSTAVHVSPSALFVSGLRGGLLTFGGAYTAIPFLQRDAVEKGKWMTSAEFLDGIALSGTLPAPLIIFSTFVGYLGGGAMGALLMTVGVFLPAFSFSLLFHDRLERLMDRSDNVRFLEGVTAGVVGIIVSTVITLAAGTLTGWKTLLIFGLALLPLYLWKSKASIPAVVILSGGIGLILFHR